VTSIEPQLMQLLTDLRTKRPDHPMFGEVAVGEVRAPFNSARKNGTSWSNVIKNIAKADKFRHRPEWGSGQCWMVRTNQITLSTTDANDKTKTIVAKRLRTARFLAFLKSPTDANWEALKSGDLTKPFDHFCGRGELTDAAQDGYVCVNGIEHGEFSTRNVNESRKQCKYGAACLCPGHGDNNQKCIFTHRDGKLQACRNNATHVPICTCDPRCY